MSMILSLSDYRKKVLGCWMGKNIGGTLGAPFEWRRQINDVSFYTQPMDGTPMPNDDLDLQLIWLIALEERGIDINAAALGEYWLLYIAPHWAEYGNGKINLRSGLMPPLSGTENNPFKDSCGAFIRSEIWACIAPGCPEIAAKYAYEDAIVDHGNGEGTYAEIFCAALQSAAFVENDVYKLIEIGLSYIPEDCGVAGAIQCVLASYNSGKTWLEARHELLTGFRGYCGFTISEEERKKGFVEGKRGWDVPSNIGIVILGWIYGQGDFEKSLCITVNCGEDTDCTAATYGSIFGIINGIDAIPEKWTKPIGRTIKTAFLNLGELGYFGSDLPQDIDNLTERVERIARQVILRYRPHVELSDNAPTDLSDLKDCQLYSGSQGKSIFRNPNGPIYKFGAIDVMVDYVDGPGIKNNVPKKIRLILENRYKTPDSLNIRWYTPDGWSVSPAKEGKLFLEHSWVSGPKTVEYELYTENVGGMNRFAVELTADGKHTVMLVPIILLSGNLE